MKKIIYTVAGLTLPLFAFSQANNTTPADTTKKQNAPVISAVQAIASKTTVTPQTAQPVSAAAQMLAGGKPAAVAPNQSKQPASAVELIQQTHQQDPAAASGQPH